MYGAVAVQRWLREICDDVDGALANYCDQPRWPTTFTMVDAMRDREVFETELLKRVAN
jgi:hypothetical protein